MVAVTERAAGPRLDSVRRAQRPDAEHDVGGIAGQQTTAMEQRHAIGAARDLVEVVEDDHHRAALSARPRTSASSASA